MMRALLVSLLLVSAPIPRHPVPSELDAIRPGWRWYYHCYLLEVTHTNGERVRYRCLNHPERCWGNNEQSRLTTWNEAIHYGVPRYP